MFFYERCSFPCTFFGMFYRTFPFHHCPTAIIILRQFAEYGLKVHLSIAKGTESSGPVYPTLVTSVNTLFSRGIEFCVFYMEHFYSFMIIINVGKVIQALQNKMTWIIQEASTFM